MAHVKKYTKIACGHLFEHFDRSAENISNESVDRSRSNLNYNLASHQKMRQYEFLQKRLGEVKCQNRADVNVLASWVVTVPKDLPERLHEDFFQYTYEFLENRYGRQNVVSAWVHLDEVTPHLHFAFVPVVESEKKGKTIYKVSAKELLTRKHLQDFHPALQRHLTAYLGRVVNVLNGATAEGNKSIKELKGKTASEIVREYRAKIAPAPQNEPRAPQVEAVQSRVTAVKIEPLTTKPEVLRRGYIDTSDEAIIERLRKCKWRLDFERLWNGESVTGNRERDDFQLLNMLAFFCNLDREQMQRIFTHSGLFRPELGQEYLDRATDRVLKAYERPAPSATDYRAKSRDRDNGNYK